MDKSGPGGIDDLKRGVESHHKRILELDRQLGELTQERALIKAAAVRDLSGALKLPNEVLGQLVAGCR